MKVSSFRKMLLKLRVRFLMDFLEVLTDLRILARVSLDLAMPVKDKDSSSSDRLSRE